MAKVRVCVDIEVEGAETTEALKSQYAELVHNAITRDVYENHSSEWPFATIRSISTFSGPNAKHKETEMFVKADSEPV